jgi:hypothetical protein
MPDQSVQIKTIVLGPEETLTDAKSRLSHIPAECISVVSRIEGVAGMINRKQHDSTIIITTADPVFLDKLEDELKGVYPEITVHLQVVPVPLPLEDAA